MNTSWSKVIDGGCVNNFFFTFVHSKVKVTTIQDVGKIEVLESQFNGYICWNVGFSQAMCDLGMLRQPAGGGIHQYSSMELKLCSLFYTTVLFKNKVYIVR